MSNVNSEWTIAYKQIGVIVVSFVLGVVIAVLLANSREQSVTNFSTTELIGFVLTVIISGASIVLAVSAIALGRSSEQAVINRSDESIRLQTELFTKTTDALQSIKASTGVTEKRIEDIISGRAGEISRQLAELASDETVAGKIDIKELEEKIRKSITGTLEKEETEEDKKRRLEERAEMRRKREEYEKAHTSLLYSMANRPSTKIVKLGHGTPISSQSEPYGRFDAVFEQDDRRIAVSTFMPAEGHFLRRNIGEILTNLAQGVEADGIESLHLVFFEEEEDSLIVNHVRGAISIMKDSLAEKIAVHTLDYAEADAFSEQLAMVD